MTQIKEFKNICALGSITSSCELSHIQKKTEVLQVCAQNSATLNVMWYVALDLETENMLEKLMEFG